MNVDREGRFDLSFVKHLTGEVPKLVQKGDVLFNNTNSPELIGKTTAIPIDDRMAYSNHMTRIRLEDGMSSVFTAKQLHFLWMSGYFLHRCKNHVNQASIAAEPLAKTVPFALPSSREQERIADTLDELLSDLDAGVAALERVQKKLKHYRAAVLKAAVEGDLTADWRAQHPDTEPASALLSRILTERRRRWEEDQLRKFREAGKEPPKNWKARYREPQLPEKPNSPSLPDSWIWTNVDTLSVPPIINGISVKGSDSPPGIAALRLSAMSENGFDYSKRRWLPLREKDVDDLWIEDGDFFVCRGNGSKKLVGRGTTAQEPPDAVIFPDTMMRLRFVPAIKETRLFPVLWASSCARTQIEKAAKTTAGIWKIAQPDLAKIVLPLPPLAEQEAIVEAVEAQLSVIDHLEADIAAKLKSAKGLRQSILRHAFTGQLVRQYPNDEPAAELLKRIATERAERARVAASARAATQSASKQAKPLMKKAASKRASKST
ncbi:MAG: hypothetical protein B7Z37_17020 [Verrucomicrobia bacterium 12-59-8]|nr:MAG: hypothetical protein B7Z37_17020 [Verrucomicrobia bacterium 12-59-8]